MLLVCTLKGRVVTDPFPPSVLLLNRTCCFSPMIGLPFRSSSSNTNIGLPERVGGRLMVFLWGMGEGVWWMLPKGREVA